MLATGFNDATPWKVVLDSTGKIIELVGFDAERLQIGAIIGPAVCEFARALNPRILDVVAELVQMLAQNPMGLPLDEIEWDKVNFDFTPLRALEVEGMPVFMMLGREVLSMPFPGAERGPYQNDANGYIRRYFLDELAKAQRAQIPHEAISLVGAMAKLVCRAKKFGVQMPDLVALTERVGTFMDKAEALPRGDRAARIALEAEYKTITGEAFGDQFPEYALPPSPDAVPAPQVEAAAPTTEAEQPSTTA